MRMYSMFVDLIDDSTIASIHGYKTTDAHC